MADLDAGGARPPRRGKGQEMMRNPLTIAAIVIAAAVSAGITLKINYPARPVAVATPIVEKASRIIPLYHKTEERAPQEAPITAVTIVQETPRKTPIRVAEAIPESEPVPLPLPRARIAQGNPLTASDVCARHGLHKVVRGKGWRCR